MERKKFTNHSQVLLHGGVPRDCDHEDLVQVNLLRTRLAIALQNMPRETRSNISIIVRFDGSLINSEVEVDPAILTEDLNCASLVKRVTESINAFVPSVNLGHVAVRIKHSPMPMKNSGFDIKEADRMRNSEHPAKAEEDVLSFRITSPLWSLDDVVMTEQTSRDILRALVRITHHSQIYDEWGMKSVDLFPKASINLFGPPGTGKTMAAHGIARYLGKQILSLSPADIESRFVGEAPKNLTKAFKLSEITDSVIFFDEADSLLGKRIPGVTQGSEQAINSLRSQMLLALDSYSGVIIFATNLPSSYDQAFLTRTAQVEFFLPNQLCRAEIWRRCLKGKLPLAKDVDPVALANTFPDVSGRDIRDAVLDAVSDMVIDEKTELHHGDFVRAIEHLVSHRKS